MSDRITPKQKAQTMIEKGLSETLQSAVALALAGEWEPSHRLVQDYNDPLSCWIHAVLHKIEGDEGNSRYWYARTRGISHEKFDNPQQELHEIARRLERS